MPLYYCKDGYTFSAEAGSLTIEPGPSAITLSRSELEQQGSRSVTIIRSRSRIPRSAR